MASKATHTPGPWYAKTFQSGNIMIRQEKAPSIVAEIMRDTSTPEARQANARLIAAAPELLDALSRCADFMGSVAGVDNVSDTFKAAYLDARQVIAKAATL